MEPMRWWLRVALAALLPGFVAAAAAQPGTTIWRCPDNLYTSQISDREAAERGCRRIDDAPITIIQGTRPRPAASAPASAAARASDSRIDADQQRQRDADARRILEGELGRARDDLQALETEYNGGQPERQGNERNYQKYLDRVAELKAAIERKRADIAALERELAKLRS